jgi:F420H(2)-dependent quinone reductase
MAEKRAGLPRWLGPANRVIVALQRRGLAIGTMRLLSVPGRRSGRLRTTPVSPLTVEGERYIVAGLEGADWVKNARAAGWGILARGREEERVRLVELPVGERAAVLREFSGQSTWGRPVLPSALRRLWGSRGVRGARAPVPRVPRGGGAMR